MIDDRIIEGLTRWAKSFDGIATDLVWLTAAIDLINRQKAEIERLQKECEITRAYIHNNGLEWGLVSHLEFYKNQKSEVIKEFAERLKVKKATHYCKCGLSIDTTELINDDIDNLVEEMEQENDCF